MLCMEHIGKDSMHVFFCFFLFYTNESTILLIHRKREQRFKSCFMECNLALLGAFVIPPNHARPHADDKERIPCIKRRYGYR
jgi:hypothetical protein